ncbi:hypothetical protein BH20ACI1_BH20ACI1_00070 [soil metagenome]
MKKLIFVLLLSSLFVFTSNAQTNPTTNKTTDAQTAKEEKPKKQIFRANKDQIMQAQTMLKEKSMYSGEATGKLDPDTRSALKKFQSENGLKATGTLNRATLEKMNIELTDKQKEIPIPASSYQTAAKDDKTDKPKRVIFRANKEQITEAQTMLKGKAMYDGEATGKLDDATRTALKKYQSENGLKSTGTLNQATLEKMGIELTDKQKEMPVSPNSSAMAAKEDKSDKPKRMIFRASKEQVMQAQKMLKTNGMYSGEETGTLNDATREGLKKYQDANGLKSTGTLNRVTLEKMGIALTDKQKENAKMEN